VKHNVSITEGVDMKTAISIHICLFCVVLAATCALGEVVSLTVPAQSNIFGAGHSVAPDPSGGGGGVLPNEVALEAGSYWKIRFPQVVGTICADTAGDCHGADGGAIGSHTNTDISSWGGISGIVHGEKTLFLVGVFCGPDEPADPAPSRLTFGETGISVNFAELYPELNQTFFIGDGRNAGGLQEFFAPAGATRLFLGFADSWDFGSDFTRPPGWYGDNSGSLAVELSIDQAPVGNEGYSLGAIKALYR
jgi:hypothetical protein